MRSLPGSWAALRPIVTLKGFLAPRRRCILRPMNDIETPAPPAANRSPIQSASWSWARPAHRPGDGWRAGQARPRGGVLRAASRGRGRRADATGAADLLKGAELRFGDVTDPVSLARDGFRGERFDALVSCLALERARRRMRGPSTTRLMSAPWPPPRKLASYTWCCCRRSASRNRFSPFRKQSWRSRKR